MRLELAQRFYETLAKIIGNKEGVDIKVTVTPKEEGQQGERGREVCGVMPRRNIVEKSG